MHFTKMHGLGNDYLYVYGEVPANVAELSIRLSDRHFGAGSDGMIFINAAPDADFSMRIFNADGSEAKMCGNGIRCVGKYVYDKGYTDKSELTVSTLSGIKTLKLDIEDGKVQAATVGMGKAEVEPDCEIVVDGMDVALTPVSVGNPHAVIFVSDAEGVPVSTVGPAIEHHPAFPGGVNVEFVQVIGPQELRMRVWERGSSITLACGTGASASVAAAVSKHFCPAGQPVTVHLDGGDLEICCAADHTITMRGPATTVYEGEV
ncbi:MAG: diaminopimelate epimerase [Coriobacteriales bacterium]|nr:diaminopimelate epimerase [Coriobacteriales bacterium]